MYCYLGVDISFLNVRYYEGVFSLSGITEFDTSLLPAVMMLRANCCTHLLNLLSISLFLIVIIYVSRLWMLVGFLETNLSSWRWPVGFAYTRCRNLTTRPAYHAIEIFTAVFNGAVMFIDFNIYDACDVEWWRSLPRSLSYCSSFRLSVFPFGYIQENVFLLNLTSLVSFGRTGPICDCFLV